MATKPKKRPKAAGWSIKSGVLTLYGHDPKTGEPYAVLTTRLWDPKTGEYLATEKAIIE